MNFISKDASLYTRVFIVYSSRLLQISSENADTAYVALVPDCTNHTKFPVSSQLKVSTTVLADYLVRARLAKLGSFVQNNNSVRPGLPQHFLHVGIRDWLRCDGQVVLKPS